MKRLYVILFMSICLGAGARNCDATGSTPAERDIMEQKCLNNSGGSLTAMTELNESKGNLMKCTQNLMRQATSDTSDEMDLFCNSSTRSTLYNCLENFTQKLARCLDEEEAFMSDFILKTYTYATEDACSDDGILKIKGFMSTFKKDHCEMRSLQQVAFKCVQRTKIFNDTRNDILTLKAADLCYDLELLNECGQEPSVIGDNDCLTNLSDLLQMILHSYLRWCKEQGLLEINRLL